jgi:hypothetical protein
MACFVREALPKRNQWPPLSAAMLSLAFILAAASVTEQMAPARQGMLQCQMPDALFKTCASLSKVVQLEPSTYLIETNMLVDPRGPVVAKMKSKVFVEGEEICDKMDPKDISTAVITSDGKSVSAASAARYIAAMHRSFSAFHGKSVCTRIVADEQGVMKVQGRVAGKRMPQLDYDMSWVKPGDGWTVAR